MVGEMFSGQASFSAESRPLTQMRNITTVIMAVTYCLVITVMLRQVLLQPADLLILTPSLLTAGWVLLRWYDPPRLQILVPLLVLGEATFLVSTLLGIHPISVLGLALTGSIYVCSLPRARRLWPTAALLALVAATGALYWLARPEVGTQLLVSSLIFAAATLVTFWTNDLSWRLFTELDAMRRTEAELAVMKERFRFASDLHDIQGHTLHVIRLKAAVAARLQHSDPERTAAELADIQRLTVETIEQSRQLANSTHTLSFETELTNAVNLLQDAGISVTVSREQAAAPAATAALFALVLREATTNILRHSQARQVSIMVGSDGLAVDNDGAGSGEPALRGLSVLAKRVAEAGGNLVVDRPAGSFRLRLTIGKNAA